MRKEFAGNAAPAGLVAGITDVAIQFEISDATGWPDGSSGFPFVATLHRGEPNEEKILCASRAGTVVSVQQRGFDGTVAAAHQSGESVLHTIDADTIRQVNQHANDGWHNVKGELRAYSAAAAIAVLRNNAGARVGQISGDGSVIIGGTDADPTAAPAVVIGGGQKRIHLRRVGANDADAILLDADAAHVSNMMTLRRTSGAAGALQNIVSVASDGGAYQERPGLMPAAVSSWRARNVNPRNNGSTVEQREQFERVAADNAHNSLVYRVGRLVDGSWYGFIDFTHEQIQINAAHGLRVFETTRLGWQGQLSAGSGDVPLFFRAYAGTTDASGNANFSHGYDNAGHNRLMLAHCWYRGGSGESKAMNFNWLDGITAGFTGAPAGVAYRAGILWSTTSYGW